MVHDWHGSNPIMTDVEVITMDQPGRWMDAHALGGLPSQSWHYAQGLLAAGIEPMLAVVNAGGSRMLMPFHERGWQDSIDITTLIGTSGAHVTNHSSLPLKRWRDHAIERGYVAGYIQLSTSTCLRDPEVGGELVSVNEWFELDISKPDPGAGFSELIRRKIRRAGSVAQLVTDRSALATRLKQLYPVTMKRVGARSNYAFPNATLDAWIAAPGSLVIGASEGAAIEAVILFLVSADQAEYHLVGSSERGRNLVAWLIAQAVELLRERGVRILHLGGGVRCGDGLHGFKQKFGGDPKPLQAVRQVYDASRYEQLCAQAGTPPWGGTWFPAYRTSPPRQS